MLGNRSPKRILNALVSAHTYLGFLSGLLTYKNPLTSYYRYIFGKGDYPLEVGVRTPLGTKTPKLYSPHDMLTLNEVFCRKDYYCDETISVAMDIGANIGLSALYFLTRNQKVKAHLYEPNPNNIEKLKRTLSEYQNRFVLHEAGVGIESGEFDFGIESSGRYGGLNKVIGSKASYEQPEISEIIKIKCIGINEAIKNVIDTHGQIDIIKIDTEGSEFDLVSAINTDNLEKIRTIYIESQNKPTIPGFHTDKFKTVFRLVRQD